MLNLKWAPRMDTRVSYRAWWGRIELERCGRGIAMKGPLYDRSTEILGREKEVILQPESQGLVKEQIDFAAVLNSTGQVLYGYSVDGIRKTHRKKTKRPRISLNSLDSVPISHAG